MLSPHQVVVLHTVSVLWSRGKNIQNPRRIRKVVPLDRHLASNTNFQVLPLAAFPPAGVITGCVSTGTL